MVCNLGRMFAFRSVALDQVRVHVPKISLRGPLNTMDRTSNARPMTVATKGLCRFAICVCILIAACSSSTPTVLKTDAGEALRISRIQVLVPGPVPQALFREAGEWRLSSGKQWGFAAFA